MEGNKFSTQPDTRPYTPNSPNLLEDHIPASEPTQRTTNTSDEEQKQEINKNKQEQIMEMDNATTNPTSANAGDIESSTENTPAIPQKL